jgi:hypothetical protein
MNTTPTTQRFVAVLNKKIEIGRVMNAVAHMAAGFTALYPNKTELRFDVYHDKDGGEHKSISDNPFIILSADNSNQIRTLRNKLLEMNISFNDFTNTMIEGTYVDQHKRTSETPELALEYWGICFFTENEQSKELTKKFSLWK